MSKSGAQSVWMLRQKILSVYAWKAENRRTAAASVYVCVRKLFAGYFSVKIESGYTVVVSEYFFVGLESECQTWLPLNKVRDSNLGLCFFPFKCCVSQLSVDRFDKNFEGVMTLGQVKSSPNFCLFGPQRAEKRNIWRGKNTILNLNSGLWQEDIR